MEHENPENIIYIFESKKKKSWLNGRDENCKIQFSVNWTVSTPCNAM